MTLSRRAFAASVLSGAALAAPTVQAMTRLAQPSRPLVIAHRGASGLRPEHTASAYRLAVAQGADFIEPDLVLTRDGAMVVRHENEIGGTTDVASRPEFAGRRVTKVVDGARIEGWFTEDFTLAELKTLRARERLPKLRPGSAEFDGRDPILTFEEVVALARAEGRSAGRTIGVYPEMKHPSYFAGLGQPFEARLAAELKRLDLDSPGAAVFVQCFEVQPLKTIRRLTHARLVQLVESRGGPADQPGVTYRQMTDAAGLKAISAYADGLGPEWIMVTPIVDGAPGPAGPLVQDAHAAGLAVHPWTVRAENYFLPEALRRGPDPAAHGDVGAVYRALFEAGVDGLFSDFPGLAAAARDAL